MKVLAVIIGLLMVFAPLASMFAWAAFDYAWWVPVGGNDGRGFALYMCHFLSIVVGVSALLAASD